MKRKTLWLTLLVSAFAFIGCGRRAEDELWLVPKGHVGWLVVIPNQPDGVTKEYEDGRLVFRFPASGVLKTKYPLNIGTMKPPRYFTVDAHGMRTPLFYTYNGDDLGKIRDGEPYLFFGFTASRSPFPYPQFFAMGMKVKGKEAEMAIPEVYVFLLDYQKKAEASNQSPEPTATSRGGS